MHEYMICDYDFLFYRELQGNGVREIEPGAFLGLPSVKHL